MKFGSLFSGIEAASVAWRPLGWECAWLAEVEPFACAVLARHYPATPNLGDVTAADWSERRGSVDLVCGGSPCQSFSVAGKRLGLADPRGNLALHYLRVVDAVRPAWVVYENVPGLLSSGKGRDFGAFLGTLGELGYGWAYRVLDAQYFGVPQRRRRIFVVGRLGDWRPAVEVLFEPASMRGDIAPRRPAGKDLARCLVSRTCGGGPLQGDPSRQTLITHALTSRYDSSEDGCGRGVPLVAGTLGANHGNIKAEHAWTGQLLTVGGGSCPTVSDDLAPSLTTRKGDQRSILLGHAVRRLTPRECERLQGFPDDYTRIPWRGRPARECPDGPRYRALGNSWAVPVARWIGGRIAALVREEAA